MPELRSAAIHITGIVQGVGFRPFVFNLAERLRLHGWVCNTAAGVDIEVDGDSAALESFVAALWDEAPPLARIDNVQVTYASPKGFAAFEIVHSHDDPNAFIPVSPDMSICPDCLRELLDPADRRYRYPFINCTNCGPRFTIIRDIPYDRPLTTMAEFEMCAECRAEYENPRDRRFHAQPVACPNCGPQIWLEYRGHKFPAEEAITHARKLLCEGKIIAIKGLGGFHLACDATNPQAVRELRRRKLRVDKPFAIMVPNLRTADQHCLVGLAGQKLLESPEHPIVLLERRSSSLIAADVAPGQHTLGIMLPYTPLHHLLLEPATDFCTALVMTSGNLSEEPIATDNEEARQRLATLADAFLMHNRAIETRTDDSVVRIFQGNLTSIRRSRGYAPQPLNLPWDAPQLLAAGAELKNTFCITRDRYAFLSHHIGDLENYETLTAFEQGVQHFERLFRIHPEALACDLHPNYLATRYAQDRAERENLPLIQVQHHHAHIAACMAEHHLPAEEAVIGVSLDGTGYGTDGNIWGGEFLVATYRNFERPYHLRYVPLPGGDLAVREPWRLALAYLQQAGIEWSGDLPPVQTARFLSRETGKDLLKIVEHQIQTGINAPRTSSMGRLFDAAAALIGLRETVSYEAQAAIELEAQVAAHEFGLYPFEIETHQINPAPLWRALTEDLRSGTHPSILAARFHNGIAMLIHTVCSRMRQTYGINKVALSGGVWQNITLLSRAVGMLQNDHFDVLIHRQIPANDGGLAFGQAVVALHTLRY